MENGSVEISAPSVQEAITEGLARLELSEAEVEVEVIDQGSRGLLGLGARDAIVRLTPVQSTQDAIAEKPDRAAGRQLVEPAAAEQEPIEEAEPAATEYEWSQDQVDQVAQQTLVELLAHMGIEAEVSLRTESPADDEPPPITVDIEGKDLDELIGRQGEVLNALQYIARLIVSREVEHWVDLVVDVQRYKERRTKSLTQLAGRIAERVARTKQPVALEPMPPNERRAIHIALRDHPSVTTQSVGKGDRRKVTIIPKR